MLNNGGCAVRVFLYLQTLERRSADGNRIAELKEPLTGERVRGRGIPSERHTFFIGVDSVDCGSVAAGADAGWSRGGETC